MASAPIHPAEMQLRQIFADELFGPRCLADPVSTSALGYLQSTTTIVQALALTELMFPRLVQYRGGIFLEAHFDPKNVDHWMAQPNTTLGAVEAVVNHIHLGIDQFQGTPKAHLPLVRRFAERLVIVWPGWAKQTYGWDIEVDIHATDDDLEITLFTKSTEPKL